MPHLGSETRHQHRGNQLAEAGAAEDRQTIQQQQGRQSRQHQRPQHIAGTGKFRESGGQQQQEQGQHRHPIAQHKGQTGEGQDHVQQMIYRVLPRFWHREGDNPQKVVFRVSRSHHPPRLRHGF
ncbi:MAG: hypothetical protein F4Z67_02530 [Synechococcus sp. SB0667_bin_8]|nr:hypothetical protein [Synechococcus sp. SB0667_bin_8]